MVSGSIFAEHFGGSGLRGGLGKCATAPSAARNCAVRSDIRYSTANPRQGKAAVTGELAIMSW